MFSFQKIQLDLLYKPEREQASVLLSPENIRNFTYIGSEKPYVNSYMISFPSSVHLIDKYVFNFSSLDAVLSFKQGAPSADVSDTHSVQLNESSCEKRRLRSHKNTEENEFILDLGAVTDCTPTAKKNLSTQQSSQTNKQATQMSSLSLLKQMLPANIAVPLKTRELLQDILGWKLLPSNAPVEPSMIYGAVHLSRLVVRLPNFINATPMSDEKLKLLLQNLDNFIEYVIKIELKMNFVST